jgi:hypothetical protein
MIKQNPSKFLVISTAAIMCGLLSTMTCTSGTYEILPVADLQASPLDECKNINETRWVFPVNGSLSYSANSACKPGQLVCSRDRFGLPRWTPVIEPFTPSDMGAEICNGKDDDCNGAIDDVAGLNSNCTNDAGGFCRQTGTIQCSVATGSTKCTAPAKLPLNAQTYYTYPYLDSQGNPGWDWDCSGTTETLFCLQSGLTQGYITNPTSSVCNTVLSSILYNYTPANWESTLCKSCSSSTVAMPQWGKPTVTITSSPTISDCGKSMPFVTCAYSGTGCVAINSDAIVVLCK